MSALTRQRVVVVSDLHMAVPDGPVRDPFGEDAAFAGLLHALASGPPTHLVLLGDTFDLVLAAGASAGLDAIAAAHPGVFRALGAFLAAGSTADVVPGNHDIDLLRPRLQQRLRELVTRAAGDPAAGGRIAFPPWVVHIPGVLYAEHGQQHHDINHFRAILTRTEGDPRRPGARPPGLCLDEARVELAARRRARRPRATTVALRATALAGRVARAGAGLTVGAGPRARRRHERRLRDHALELGLPRDVLLEVDRRATPTPLAVAGRLRARGGNFMLEAARGVSGVLAQAGAPTAFYVFGHTHVAEDRLLADRPGAPRYLNAGTWSTMVRPGRDGAEDRLRFIEIEHGAGRPATARLRRWQRT